MFYGWLFLVVRCIAITMTRCTVCYVDELTTVGDCTDEMPNLALQSEVMKFSIHHVLFLTKLSILLQIQKRKA